MSKITDKRDTEEQVVKTCLPRNSQKQEEGREEKKKPANARSRITIFQTDFNFRVK